MGRLLDIEPMQIGFVGLGKLGLPCAEVMAEQHDVVGYDIEPRPTQGVSISRSLCDAVRDKDLVFVAVPTPHEVGYDGSAPSSHLPPKEFDYRPLVSLLHDVDDAIVRGQRVVVISTVLPGTCRALLAPALSTGTLIYNPYFIAMGTVKEDFCRPEMIAIGAADAGAADELAAYYETIIGPQKQFTGTWEEAEAIKVFYNTFIGLKLTFANMVQDVSVRLGNMNVDNVLAALGECDARLISTQYFKAGMGDGGPCHPRDNIALSALSERLGLGYDFFRYILLCREQQAKNLANYAITFGHPVVVVGATYKPGVPLMDGSSGVLTASYLEDAGALAGFVDPLVGVTCIVAEPATYILAHRGVHDVPGGFFPGSVIVDPWREMVPIPGCTLIPYGAP